MNDVNRLFIGDCKSILPTLEAQSVQTVVTSPPYFGLRDYGVAGQFGQEKSVEEYVENLVSVFRAIRRVLKDDGTVWLNLGDSYAGSGKNRNADGESCGFQSACKQSTVKGRLRGNLKKTPLSGSLKHKDLIGVPWRVAFALQAEGWYLRQDIIWHKPNVMPEPVKDRCTKSHEYIFLLSKNRRYYFDYKAIQEDAVTCEKRLPAIVRNRKYGYNSKLNAMLTQFGKKHAPCRAADAKSESAKRNKRDVWTINTEAYKGAHFAAFPLRLVMPCILAGSRAGDTVLDPFFGSGTVAEAAALLGRSWIGIELNPAYEPLYKERLALFA